MAGLSRVTGAPETKFTGGGKELEDDFNLNWYHYGARYYDPQLGRWQQVDPADEFHSPYLFCKNNPVNCIDPDGNETIYASEYIGVCQELVLFFTENENQVGRFSGQVEVLDKFCDRDFSNDSDYEVMGALLDVSRTAQVLSIERFTASARSNKRLSHSDNAENDQHFIRNANAALRVAVVHEKRKLIGAGEKLENPPSPTIKSVISGMFSWFVGLFTEGAYSTIEQQAPNTLEIDNN